MSATARSGRTRVRIRVRGTVQGVGFRPYVHRLATELSLGGFVFNDTAGVLAEVEGSEAAVRTFLTRLQADAPPLAVVEELELGDRPVTGDTGFSILPSPPGGVPEAPVTPDTATCADCLAELMDPADRRYRYPFINCTNCGPRFTIIRGIPYDRPLTTMAAFGMCDRCQAEYDDPADRRFHAQPNACPDCGPSLRLVRARDDTTSGHAARASAEVPPAGEAALAGAVAALRSGAIVAIKGIGGYHLACLAGDETAVSRLRARKHREDRPFAVMAPDLTCAATLVQLGDEAAALLTDAARPIVLVGRRTDAAVAPAVAPGAPELGVMLPYAPLHHLLLSDLDVPIVLTSGNVSDEPIAFTNEDAGRRLASIADVLLTHDRPIHTRTDDSVVRVSARGGRLMLRRSRGYVPAALALPGDGTPRPLLACGAELKNTFCLARGRRAWVSHHIGDLANYETLRSYTDGIAHLSGLFAVTPEVVVCDLHPDYLSTRHAQEQTRLPLLTVQHHHAHLAACLAEHGETGEALGVIFDGTGLGTDGTVWGGEFLAGSIAGSARVGALITVPLPGGERAIRQPWRMACAWLAAAGTAGPPLPSRLAADVTRAAWEAVAAIAAHGIASPPTSSMGRLFDAVAALSGIRAEVTYEGQAAIELEAACDRTARGRYPVQIGREAGRVVLDPLQAIRAIATDADAGVAAGVIAQRFHAGIAAATVEATVILAGEHRLETVVLSGGVFQNRTLLDAVSSGLGAAGLRVLVPAHLPVNDGAIAYGQAAAAAARLAAGEQPS